MRQRESVWDYPRPPRVEPVTERIRLVCGGITVADTRQAQRVLETSHPPVYYLPRADVRLEFLAPVPQRRTYCEYKGEASYWSLVLNGERLDAVAWSYENPTPAFAAIRSHLAFYAGRRMGTLETEGFVGDERVQPQPGGFYGGWITANLEGPFKGGPGSHGW